MGQIADQRREDMKPRQKRDIEALASVIDYATRKEVMDKTEITEAEKRLDKILASFERDRKFFKRLL